MEVSNKFIAITIAITLSVIGYGFYWMDKNGISPEDFQYPEETLPPGCKWVTVRTVGDTFSSTRMPVCPGQQLPIVVHP
jgi:uncharacterized protein YcfL